MVDRFLVGYKVIDAAQERAEDGLPRLSPWFDCCLDRSLAVSIDDALFVVILAGLGDVDGYLNGSEFSRVDIVLIFRTEVLLLC